MCEPLSDGGLANDEYSVIATHVGYNKLPLRLDRMKDVQLHLLSEHTTCTYWRGYEGKGRGGRLDNQAVDR